MARADRRRAHRGGAERQSRAPRDRSRPGSVRSPRSARVAPVARICSAATNSWSSRPVGVGDTRLTTLFALFVMDTMEFGLAIVGRDSDRAGAILGSWRWLFHHRRRIRERRRQRHEFQVLSDEELRRLQVGGASRLKRFFVTLVREGLDRARGILPPEALGRPRVRRRRGRFRRGLLRRRGVRRDPRQRDDGAAQSTGADTDVVSLTGHRGTRRHRAVAHRFAQSRGDPSAVDRAARAARLVVADVASLLRVVVTQRRGHRFARHARLRRCSPSPARSCSVGWASCRALALIFAVPIGAIGVGRLLQAVESRIAPASSPRSPTWRCRSDST